jgi:hypothetical protein
MNDVPEFDLNTPDGGRGYIAELFKTVLKRHDYRQYIAERLAGDFACTLAQHFDRMKAERDALQLRLNAADQRIDELEGVLHGLYRSDKLSVRQDQLVHATLNPAPQPATVFGFPVVVDPTMAPDEMRLVMPADAERERLTAIIEKYPNGDPLEYNAAVRKIQQ